MLKPSFRLFIVPLGAVATLATLSAQNVQPRAQRDTRFDVRARTGGGLQHQESQGGLRDLLRQRDPPLNFLASQASNLPSNLQRPGRDAPRRVALLLAPDFVCIARKSLTET